MSRADDRENRSVDESLEHRIGADERGGGGASRSVAVGARGSRDGDVVAEGPAWIRSAPPSFRGAECEVGSRARPRGRGCSCTVARARTSAFRRGGGAGTWWRSSGARRTAAGVRYRQSRRRGTVARRGHPLDARVGEHPKVLLRRGQTKRDLRARSVVAAFRGDFLDGLPGAFVLEGRVAVVGRDDGRRDLGGRRGLQCLGCCSTVRARNAGEDEREARRCQSMLQRAGHSVGLWLRWSGVKVASDDRGAHRVASHAASGSDSERAISVSRARLPTSSHVQRRRPR